MTLEATREVAVPLVSGVVIIITVFMPLLALQGLEGRLFSPVALTIAFALVAALMLSLTVVPALCRPSAAHRRACTSRGWCARCTPVYDPLLAYAMRRPYRRVRGSRAWHCGGRRRVPAHRPDLHARDG